jgi:hypothetical protein
MRILLVRIGCAILAMLVAVQGSPAAQADDASFVSETRALGFQQWDDVLIRMGRSACRFLQPNLRRHASDVELHIMRYASVEPGQAHQFLIMAVSEYCPQYGDRVGA